ncbi:MAG: 3-deoxy-D-manno-octulosonic acid transferase, partial [Neisseriaceae bacterium]|nr:3-deoxy-D-manno-octulosonic acid transferase [Neisseriaceae bacterium]
QKRHIPMILANARLSEKSAKGYERFRGLFQDAFASFASVLTQTQNDA